MNEELNIVSENSHLKYLSILNKILNLDKVGYGSVVIRLDQTFDLFQMKEREDRYYSLQLVLSKLEQENFNIKEIDDMYDAKDFLIIWNKNKQSCNERIKMNIEFNIQEIRKLKIDNIFND